ALLAEEGGREDAGAVGGRVALLVPRHVRPVGRVARDAGRARRHAPVREREADLHRRAAGEDLVVAAAVLPGAVADVVDVTGADVAGDRGRGGVAGVVVGFPGVPQRHGVAVGVDDIVEVPPVRLDAPRGGEAAGVVARLAGVVAEHRSGVDRVALRLAADPAGQPVQPEVVLGAVGRGHLPVLVVVVAVGRVGEPLALGTVVVLDLPDIRACRYLDEFTGVPGHGQGGVVGTPAQVADTGPAVVHTRFVRALDRAGREVEAVAEPGRLV